MHTNESSANSCQSPFATEKLHRRFRLLVARLPVFTQQGLILLKGGYDNFPAYDYVICKEHRMLLGVNVYDSLYQQKPQIFDFESLPGITLDLDYLKEPLIAKRQSGKLEKKLLQALQQAMATPESDAIHRHIMRLPYSIDAYSQDFKEESTKIFDLLMQLKLLQCTAGSKKYYISDYGYCCGLVEGYRTVPISDANSQNGNAKSSKPKLALLRDFYVTPNGLKPLLQALDQVNQSLNPKPKPPKVEKLDFETRLELAKHNIPINSDRYVACLDKFVHLPITTFFGPDQEGLTKLLDLLKIPQEEAKFMTYGKVAYKIASILRHIPVNDQEAQFENKLQFDLLYCLIRPFVNHHYRKEKR